MNGVITKLPSIVEAEPGWSIILLRHGKVVLAPITAWRLSPRAIDTGPMGRMRELIVGCEPCYDGGDDPMVRMLSNALDPSTPRVYIEEYIERFRAVHEADR